MTSAADQPESGVHPDAWIHPSAVVDEGARLGAGTKVWHGAHVCAGASIGPGCVLGQNVFVAPDVPIGAGCKIQNNVSIYAGVILEDEVFVGPSAVFTNVMNPRAHVSRRHEFAPTRVGYRATIGANATVVCSTTLGAGAFVAAGAVVTKDVAPRVLVMGNPAAPAGWRCDCGEALAGWPAAAEGPPRCAPCGAAYKVRADGGLDLTTSDLTTSDPISGEAAPAAPESKEL